MTNSNNILKRALLAVMLGTLAASSVANAQVSAQEAGQLKTTLTPLGGERAGNKEGTIPAWTGGYTNPSGAFKQGRRMDPFANEKPLFSITAKNMNQYADKLTDGIKAMLKRFPESYRIDVYPTHRTEVAPQFVYDNTFKNATRAKLVSGSTGPIPVGAWGGIPFPIPHNGSEVMWNHLLRWQGRARSESASAYLVTPEGRRVLITETLGDVESPYYGSTEAPKNFDGLYFMLKGVTVDPPIRVGEGIIGFNNLDESKSDAWVYLTGQRRTRKLPNPCCDTPIPNAGGLEGFDEAFIWGGRLGLFNWKLLGKKEMYVPYNCAKANLGKISDVLGPHHMNPDYLRWELHRVWVVEATLAPGHRHQTHRGMYYVDEDSWYALLGDRWDSKGDLWKVAGALPMIMPDMPGNLDQSYYFYDLAAGSYVVTPNVIGSLDQTRFMPAGFSKEHFAPEALAGAAAR
jgi:hypothetical protein